MRRIYYIISGCYFIFSLYGCATTPSYSGGAYLPTHENACRNYHKILSSKGQRYKCVEIYADGGKYDGEFINDFVKDGQGTYFFYNSSRYEGAWRNDKMEGVGKFWYANGDRYEGSFKNGLKDGFGIEYLTQNAKYTKYEGDFRNGKFNGQGKLYDFDGKVVVDGVFEEGNHVPNYVVEQRKRAYENERLENERRAKEQQAEVERITKQKEILAKIENERVEREGDGSPDDLLCKKYGLKPQTNGYAECRMRVDFAKTESKRQQEQYEREQAEYERQIAAIEREKERRRGAAFLELGARMMGGQSPMNALGSLGAGTPIAPTRPAPINQTITLPGGRTINCTTMGTMTNCF